MSYATIYTAQGDFGSSSRVKSGVCRKSEVVKPIESLIDIVAT